PPNRHVVLQQPRDASHRPRGATGGRAAARPTGRSGGTLPLDPGFLPGPHHGLLVRGRDRRQAPPPLLRARSPRGRVLPRPGSSGPPPRGDRRGAGPAPPAPDRGRPRGRAETPRSVLPGGAELLASSDRART